MTAKLITQINGQTRHFTCESGLTFGRDSHSDVALNDPLASRNHAVLRQMRGNSYVLTDMGSTNGTYLNNRRISEPTVVKDGDVIRIGSSTFEFQKEHTEVVTSIEVPERTVISKNIRVAEITVLISDIRNFTQLSESVPIETLTQIISQWSRDVAQVVVENGGTVDKFIGDCVYARWESDNPPGSVMNALRTAKELNRISALMNEQYADLPLPLMIGVGINTGSAAVDFSQENTAIGDAVNIAFRLESASKELGKDIVISQSSYRHLPGNGCAERSQTIRVKGKKDPITVSGLDFAELPLFLEQKAR